MRFAYRKIALAVLFGFALAAAGCGSNNKGKIEGKWKLVSAPTSEPKGQEMMNKLNEMGIYFAFEFNPDGTFTMGLAADKPEKLEVVKAMAKASGKQFSWNAKYKLLPGDGVEIYGMPPEMQEEGLFGKKDRAKVNVTIQGDEMTLKDAKDTLKLAKLK